jgi:hypothetical protein
MDCGLAFEPYSFEEWLTIKLKERYPGATVSLFDVEKVNGIKHRAILIQKEEERIVPTIYIDDYRMRYEMTHDIDAICDEIVERNEANQVNDFDVDTLVNFERVKPRVCAKLVNKEKSEGMLENVPHRDFLDLAIVYFVYLDGYEGLVSAMIQNQMLSMWRTTEEELYTLAMQNIQTLLPATITPMLDILKELMGETEDGEDLFSEEEEPKMYVATNCLKTFGAAVLLYSHFLEEVADKLQGDFIVLPSSCHEVLIIPAKDGNFDKDAYLEMVTQVNSSEIKEEEFLANNVYFYETENGTLTAFI